MKKIIPLLFGLSAAYGQVIDTAKYVWAPGFSVVPNIGSLQYTDELTDGFEKYSSATNNNVKYYQDTTSKDYLRRKSVIDYGIKFGWNAVLFQQWFNSASFSFDMFKPDYGDKMARFKSGENERPVKNTDTAKSSYHMGFSDVVLHAGHSWGSVLPYFGIGADLYHFGGHLGYSESLKASTMVVFAPIGAYFQMSPSISGKMQLNIPVSSESKYYGQDLNAVQVTNNGNAETQYEFSYPSKPQNTYKHDIKTSLGYEASLLANVPMLGADFKIEPYLKVWHLDKKISTEKYFAKRLRSIGIRAILNF